MPERYELFPDNGRPEKEIEPTLEPTREIEPRYADPVSEKGASKLKTLAGIMALAGVVGCAGLLYEAYQDAWDEAEGTVRAEKMMKYVRNHAKLSEAQQKELEFEVKQIESEVGDTVFSHILTKDRREAEARKHMPASPDIEGFEKIGIDNESLRPLLDDSFYPAGFMGGNVPGFSYRDTSMKGAGWSASPALTNPDSRIVFERPALAFFNENRGEESSMGNMWSSFIHEGGHASDWEHRMNLDPGQRINFFHEVLDVFDHGRKYQSPRIEVAVPEENVRLTYNKSEKQSDEKLMKLYVVGEWWAELCTGYLEFPNVFMATASDGEKALIEKWIKGGDKKFDPYKTRDTRHKVWREIQMKTYQKLKAMNMDADAGFRKK